jgi:uncharacterized protein (DUF1810 family)
MPTFLDVAIGTLFVFLLFSLVVSALNEYILSLTDQRAKFLRLGLAELFGKGVTKEAARGVRRLTAPVQTLWSWLATFGGLRGGGDQDLGPYGNALLKHGLLNAFSRSDNGGTSPSYIPAGAFVAGLLDLLVKPGAPQEWSVEQADVLNKFIAATKVAQPVSDVTYANAIAGFAASYSTLPTAPATGSVLASLNTKVTDAAAKPKLKADLLDAGTLPDAEAIINQQSATLTAELRPLFENAKGDLQAFKNSIDLWFTPAAELSALERAAASAMSSLLYPAVQQTAEAIYASIESLPPGSQLKEGLQSLFRAAEGDVQKFKTAVEGWFNGVMDRAGGWYKRFAQKWMIVIGLVLAAALNVDTIEIIRVLSNNPNLAKAVADQAGTYVHTQGRPLSASELGELREARLQAVQAAEQAEKDARAAAEKDEAKLKTLAAAVAKARADADTLEAYQAAVKTLFSAGLPIGWTPEVKKKLGLPVAGEPAAPAAVRPGATAWATLNWTVLFFMILGWFVTAIAASLGASFWFDLLSRFVNIRNAGRPPGEKETTSTPSKPPPSSLDVTPPRAATPG